MLRFNFNLEFNLVRDGLQSKIRRALGHEQSKNAYCSMRRQTTMHESFNILKKLDGFCSGPSGYHKAKMSP